MKPSRRLPTILLILCTGFLLHTLNGTRAVQAQQVQVNAADPASTEQGTINLNVKVTGKGFKNGAQAKWFVTGTTNPGGVTVNSTTFVSSTEVTANITVSDTAVIANFDIQVLNSDGRGGKGTELFAVTAKGNQASCPVQPPPPTGDTKCYAASPGCLDTSFGGGVGFVNTHHGSAAARYVSGVAVQPDGKIVTVGVARPSGTADDVAVTRFNSDGSLDNLFGDADPLNPGFRLGYVVTSITSMTPTDYVFVRAVTLQNDGKIVLSGSYAVQNNQRLIGFVLRYNANGTLDGTFGSGGRVNLDFGKRFPSPQCDVAIQADGKIVIGGAAQFGFAAARLLADGSFDTSFGSGGVVAPNPSGVSGGTSVGFSMTIQRVLGEERIVLAGSSQASSGDDRDWTLMRLRSNGAPDTSFGTNGVVKTPFFGYHDQIRAVTIDHSNRIVAAGYTSPVDPDVCGGYVIDFAVVRYNEDGTLDLSFGGGKQMADFYGGHDEAEFGVVVQSDNKIVGVVEASNNYYGPSGPSVSDFGLVRFNVDGSRDSSFGPLGNGLVTTDLFGKGDHPWDIVLQPSDGKIIVVGFASGVSQYELIVARYWP
jgi:uncharacterized delta-60 repeat protein